MELITDNLAATLVFLGLAILALEIVILGFSTFVLFFLGLGCAATGAAMYVGIIPETPVNGLVGVAVMTGALAFLLWKPLQKMQNKVEHTVPQSDLIGYGFVLEDDISTEQSSKHKYSGIEWEVVSENELVAGTEVEVIKTDVGIFTVAAKAS